MGSQRHICVYNYRIRHAQVHYSRHCTELQHFLFSVRGCNAIVHHCTNQRFLQRISLLRIPKQTAEYLLTLSLFNVGNLRPKLLLKASSLPPPPKDVKGTYPSVQTNAYKTVLKKSCQIRRSTEEKKEPVRRPRARLCTKIDLIVGKHYHRDFTLPYHKYSGFK